VVIKKRIQLEVYH